MNSEVIYYPKESISSAVEQFKTPFFLYEESMIRKNCRTFKNAFTKYFPNFQALYAIKANPNPDIVRIIASEGFGADVSSEAEAWLCKRLGISGIYTGNYTTKEEFSYAKNCDVILNLDDISMLTTLAELGMPETLSLRINPGMGKATIESNIYSGPDAKYGIPFEKAVEAYALAQKLGVKHFGIHMMTGSNVPTNEQDYFENIVSRLFEIVNEIKNKTGIEIEFLNMGGGFGVPYHPNEKSLDMDYIAKGVRRAFDQQCKKFNLKEPKLYAEPGRYITANAGFLVGKVHVIKDSYKKFVGIDAGSTDMPRPQIYGAYHHISVLNESAEKEIVSVVGRICENSDQFAKDRLLPKCKVGDIIIIHNCGGHARAMSYNYNGRPRSAEYLHTEKGEFKCIRPAETIEDLYINTNI